jgi:hypothetical protein
VITLSDQFNEVFSMNTILSLPRLTLRSLMQHRLSSIMLAVVSALMIGMVSTNVFAANDTLICSTGTTRMEMSQRGTAVIYGTAAGGTHGTLFVADIPLSSIRNITDAERASGKKISITSYDSPIVKGWHVEIYWQNEHYGVQLTSSANEGNFADDTGAICGL